MPTIVDAKAAMACVKEEAFFLVTELERDYGVKVHRLNVERLPNHQEGRMEDNPTVTLLVLLEEETPIE